MSSHLTPSAKRRRLDAAQSTLSKPFKSPLRRAVATNEPAATCDTESTCSNEASAAQATQSAKKERSSILVCDLSAKTSLQSATVPLGYLKDPQQDTIKKASLHGVDISSSSDAQDRIRQLQKQLSSLHYQLSNLRTALDTTTQAVQIEQLKQDPELEALIVKWRLVAREATEELFASARERVNRMGGVGAWKEKIKQSHLRRAEWDACRAEDPPAADEEEGSDVEREREARRREIIEVENDNYQEVGVTEDDREEEQDETFTVDMLLSNLNIDLKVGRDMDGAAKQTGFFVLSHVPFGEYAQRASMVARRWYIISDSKTN
ncbi:hypothetical protein LOY89_000939 [Ophidiomyces ophidiicola]|uniref:uncharacterized protein n=1 Tax=Ophidiomyces ophidiicola TaxID=1387563 RepID=UPI0020C505A1|nr:uncharacterized protein LOZ57_003457 [Ophidiomyces ophidiicola]KAI1947218.1 hypothetical protein LOZ57_003457 [Ophidiomyces ophidiicola]KAI2380190.1 hypothetical protein LOY89_000939 [Ophidiomyces ophidiicola]KAI2412434.1 hypothetical protein LOY90_001954 [Ophidiomyces ophidiicola]